MAKVENYIFITGMFRSGTTLLARALNAHLNIKIASDPYLEFFKAFRNEIYRKNRDRLIDDNAPLEDKFFDYAISSTREIRNGNFDLEIKNQNLDEIKSRIIKTGEAYSPLIMPLIKDVNAKNYKELFEKLMILVEKAYGDEQTKYIGIKEVWAEEFIAPLINAFPNIKCIHILRDPRAIVASRKASKLKMYPLLFLIRHWRKSIAYCLLNYHKKKNYYFLRYEDYITFPEHFSRKICKFLNIEYDGKMIDGSEFRDGRKQKWTQNSSYGTSNKITTKFMSKWKAVLSKEEIQYIEDLCNAEMRLLNYKRLTQRKIFHSCFHPPYEDKNNIEDWILPYANDFMAQHDNSIKELIRYYMIENRKNIKKYLDKDLAEKIFIDRDFLEKIDKFWEKGLI